MRDDNLGLVGNIGRPPRPGTSVIHPSIHPIHTLTLHSYPSFSPYLSFLPTRHPTRPSARVGQTTIPFAACAQLSSSALGRTPQRSSFSVPGLNIQVSVTWTYLASCISLSTNRARHSSRSTGWARDGPSRGSAFVLVSKTDPLLPGSHAPAVHPATPKDIISSSPFLSSLAQSSSLRAPADASSGYSGHRQVPASHENGANGNGNHLSSTKADSTSGPISKKPADFENFWDAPAYLWTPKEVTEREIEAVMVSPRGVRCGAGRQATGLEGVSSRDERGAAGLRRYRGRVYRSRMVQCLLRSRQR
jgi:small subunit ribosomal protein YMR-31